MAEEKKQMYIGVKILQDAQPMTAAKGKEAGLVTETYDGESEGYKVTYEDGYGSWSPKSVFESAYQKVTAADAKMLDKLEDSPVKNIKLALEIRGHVNKIEKKQSSLKHLGSDVLKTFGVDLNEINNDSDY